MNPNTGYTVLMIFVIVGVALWVLFENFGGIKLLDENNWENCDYITAEDAKEIADDHSYEIKQHIESINDMIEHTATYQHKNDIELDMKTYREVVDSFAGRDFVVEFDKGDGDEVTIKRIMWG